MVNPFMGINLEDEKEKRKFQEIQAPPPGAPPPSQPGIGDMIASKAMSTVTDKAMEAGTKYVSGLMAPAATTAATGAAGAAAGSALAGTAATATTAATAATAVGGTAAAAGGAGLMAAGAMFPPLLIGGLILSKLFK